MNLAYFTIQYVADPLRGEGRNVAVLGIAEGRGYLRAAGLGRDGKTDLAEFRATSGLSVEESAIVPDWIEYFRCVAMDDAHSLGDLARVLGRLAGPESAFIVGGAGEAELGAAETPERAMDRVFDRVVGHPPSDRVDRFPERLERLLYVSELQSYPDFVRNVEIDLRVDSATTTVAFDFALVDAPAIGFRVVRWRGDPVKTGEELRAALAEFEKSWQCNFLSRMRSVILTDSRWPNTRLSKQLAREGCTVIDAMADDAVEVLRDLLQRRATSHRV